MFVSGIGVSIVAGSCRAIQRALFTAQFRFIPSFGPGCACKIAETCVRVCFNGSQTSFACSAENSSRGRSERALSTRRSSILDRWIFFNLTLCRWLQNIDDKYLTKCATVFSAKQQRVPENFYLPTNDDRNSNGRRYDKYQIYSGLTVFSDF